MAEMHWNRVEVSRINDGRWYETWTVDVPGGQLVRTTVIAHTGPDHGTQVAVAMCFVPAPKGDAQ